MQVRDSFIHKLFWLQVIKSIHLVARSLSVSPIVARSYIIPWSVSCIPALRWTYRRGSHWLTLRLRCRLRGQALQKCRQSGWILCNKTINLWYYVPLPLIPRPDMKGKYLRPPGPKDKVDHVHVHVQLPDRYPCPNRRLRWLETLREKCVTPLRLQLQDEVYHRDSQWSWVTSTTRTFFQALDSYLLSELDKQICHGEKDFTRWWP